MWLGNNRGNIYCRSSNGYVAEKHPVEFYDYSFFEMGEYDLPAMIDGILNYTGRKTLTYLGYSQGATQMFSALALNQGDLQSKVNYFIALAPVVRLDHSTNPFLLALKKSPDWIDEALKDLEVNQLFGQTWADYKEKICSQLDYKFCYGAGSLIEDRLRWPLTSKNAKPPVPLKDQ